jgi:YVTN family beta-propeller protein
MLYLVLTTLLTMPQASGSPEVTSGATSSGQTTAPDQPTPPPRATPRPGTPTVTPVPRNTPTPNPKGSPDRLVVVNKSDNSVSILDASNGKLKWTAPVETGPHEAEVLADGRTVAISDYGRANEPGKLVSLVDMETGKVVSRIDLGDGARPHGLEALRDGRLLITAEGKKELVVADPRTAKITARIPTGRDLSHMVAASRDGHRAYVTSLAAGGVSIIDLTAGKVLQFVETGKGAEGVDITPDGREVWVTNRGANTISVVDTKTAKVTATIKAGEFPIRVKFTPDGRRALVSFTGSGDVGVFDVASRAQVKRIALGRDAVAKTDGRVFQKRFGTSSAPVGLFIEPDGRRAWVAASHADVVVVIDLDQLRVDDAWVAGAEPDGLAGKFGKR